MVQNHGLRIAAGVFKGSGQNMRNFLVFNSSRRLKWVKVALKSKFRLHTYHAEGLCGAKDRPVMFPELSSVFPLPSSAH